MQVEGQVALVTGANRGIGRRFVDELRTRGAAKIYATARDAGAVDVPGVEPLTLDITDPNSVARAAAAAPDVTLLVNNAGILVGEPLVTGDLDRVRREVDTHLWGTLDVIRAFAPALGARGGGAVVTMLSAMSWFSAPGLGSYSVAKAAAWAMTNSVRVELAAQGTLVTAVHVGAVDTDMQASYDGPKVTPESVVAAALDGVEAGDVEVLADRTSARVKAALAEDPALFYGAGIVAGP